MNCPRCQGAALEERERDGVVIDVCHACRGVWLDRGELEKLIARATREFDEVAPRQNNTPPREVRYRDDDDDDQYRRDPRKKRSWFDIFD